MPEEWKQLLKNSNISSNEQIQNPEAVINACVFYHMHKDNAVQSKFMYSSDKSRIYFELKYFFL
jgi:hypothetical protein